MIAPRFIRYLVRQYSSSSCRRAVVVVKVPALGESITEGSIAKWTKVVGDKVRRRETVNIRIMYNLYSYF